MIFKLSLLAVFGIAMAHLEGVVVVYVRKALGIPDSESNKESVRKNPDRFLIPKPWIAPVWFPVVVSSLTLIIIAILFVFKVL